MGAVVNIVLRAFDLHFQSQQFSCYAFAIKQNVQAADVPGKLTTTRTAPRRGVAAVIIL